MQQWMKFEEDGNKEDFQIKLKVILESLHTEKNKDFIDESKWRKIDLSGLCRVAIDSLCLRAWVQFKKIKI